MNAAALQHAPYQRCMCCCRSRNAELGEGSTDGKYRKARPDTYLADPNAGAEIVRANRSALHIDYYDVVNSESPMKVNPGHR